MRGAAAWLFIVWWKASGVLVAVRGGAVVGALAHRIMGSEDPGSRGVIEHHWARRLVDAGGA
jgi:hypothetical protein